MHHSDLGLASELQEGRGEYRRGTFDGRLALDAMQANDGDIGKVVNFWLDDDRWTVRYLVVDTGSFLEGRRVLVSPISFRDVGGATRRLYVDLTMEKVKHSPSVAVDKPVSRQHERGYLRYYGYSSYWGYA